MVVLLEKERYLKESKLFSKSRFFYLNNLKLKKFAIEFQQDCIRKGIKDVILMNIIEYDPEDNLLNDVIV